jgi:segregation and condensation protein A
MEQMTFHLESVVRQKDELHDFTGPLSLILLLLTKNKIEIQDLVIGDILDQYLDYIERMREMDLDVASEFVQMASHLLYLKTRTLLAGDEQEPELDELIVSLERLRCQGAYAGIQSVAGEFASRLTRGALSFSKEPEPIKLPNRALEYSCTSLELLIALAEVFSRGDLSNADFGDVFVPRRIVFSVRRKSVQLIELLRAAGRVDLKTLYSMAGSRSEVVATFISVLDLLAAGSLTITDNGGVLAVELTAGAEIPSDSASMWESA